MTERSDAHRPDLGARPDRLDRRRRGEVARLARRAASDARARRGAGRLRRRPSPRRGSTPSSCSAWAARASRPEVLGGRSARASFHVLDTTHPKAIRALESSDRPRAHAVRLRLEVGLDARDAVAHGLLLGEDGRQGEQLRRDHRPWLRARANWRRSGSSATSSPASRRSAAATRRCRRSGSSRPRCSASTSTRCSRALRRRPRRAGATEDNPGYELGRALRRPAGSEGRDKICIADTRAASASGPSS